MSKNLSTSALAHSASSLQIKHEKSYGINHIKHWSELDAALETMTHQHGVDIFATHHSKSHLLPDSIPPSFLESDDESANEDIDYLVHDFDYREPQQRLHGTPLVGPIPELSPHHMRTFVNLSASNTTAVLHSTKPSRKVANVNLDKVTGDRDDLAIFPNGKSWKNCTDSVLRKNSSQAPKPPAVVHRGLPSTSSCPDLSPISFKLLNSNEMPKPVARAPLSGSPLRHPFRIANKKSPPSGNVEAAVQIFKVDVSLPVFSQMYDPKTFRIHKMHPCAGTNHATTTPAAPINALQCEKYELPPIGEIRPHEYWGQEKPLEEASRCVTQPPRDYGLIIHLALNRPK